MSEIRTLDSATVSRIAAGEVVERPASVVKELVENSLDADASQIEVEVDGDGTERIAVRDNGVGMSREEVELAVEQHTTSKIQDADDLDSGVSTLGFRGEALYTIGAVSRTTITSRPQDGDRTATELRLAGGDIESVEPTGRPHGTTIEVRDLFYNTPARREFLSAPSTEFTRINRVVSRYALARPDVAISLTHDGSETFATPGDGDRRGTVLAVYGRQVAESMIEVDASPDDSPIESVAGYVSNPETTRSTRAYLGTYVNGRYVSDSVLREAIVDAYGGQLAADRFPFTVLDVTLPPESVDANVHPRKLEVRFEDEESVREAVTEAVHDALLEHGLARTRAPRGRSQPQDATITPDHGESNGLGGDSESEEAAVTEDDAGTALEDADDDGGEHTGQTSREPSPPTDEGDAATASARKTTESADGADYGSKTETQSGDSTEQVTEASNTDTSSTPPAESSESAASDRDETTASGPSKDASTSGDGASETSGQKFAGSTQNARLPGTGVDDEDASERSHEQLPEMRLLGQLHDTYVVGETPDGMVLIDQHAADERVRYEELQTALNDSPDSQALVTPARVEVTTAEAASFEAALPTLTDLGFGVTLEGQTAVVSAVPAVFGHLLDADIVQDALASATTAAADEDILSAADALLADMACKPAIKGNTSLQEGDITALLDRLDACEDPWACPHGRPVVIEFNQDELDARFERDYPGHQDRAPE